MNYRKKIKSLFLFLISLSVLLLTGFFIKEVGTELADRSLKEKIQETLPEGYALSYGELSLDLWEKEIKVKNILFYPDTVFPKGEEKRIIQLHIPVIDIRLASLRSIFFQKELIVEGIRINDPEVLINDRTPATAINISGTSISLFEMVTHYLHLFEIDKMAIDDARLQYNLGEDKLKEKLHLEDIDFVLHKFSLDTTLTRHRFLNAESIELVIHKQRFSLPDQIHEFSFDQFRLSTLDSVLTFKNLSLQPREQPLMLADPSPAVSLQYSVSVPELALQGVDYYKTYLNQELNIRKLTLQEPDIYIEGSKSVLSVEGNGVEPGNDVVQELLSRFSPSLKIDQLGLIEGSVHLNMEQPAGLNARWHIEELEVFDFSYEAGQDLFDEKAPPFQSFRGKIRNLKQRWPDGFHRVAIKELSFNSEKKELEAKEVEVIPLEEKKDIGRSSLYQSVPILQIRGINLMESVFGAPLHCDGVYLIAPKTQLLTDLSRDSLRTPILASVRQSISDFFVNKWNARKLIIEKGRFSLNEQLKVEEYSLRTGIIRLSSQINSWEELIPDFSLNLKGISFYDSLQSVQAHAFNTDGKDHFFENLDLHWETPQIQLSTKLKYLAIFETELDSLMAGYFCADSMALSTAKVKIKMKEPVPAEKENRKPFFSLPLPFQADQISLNKSSISLQLPDKSQLSADNFNGLFRIDNWFHWLHFSMENLLFQPANQNHQLQLARFSKPSFEENYQLEQLEVRPVSEDNSWIFPISVPSLILTGLDRERLLLQNELSFKKVEVKEPDLNFHQRRSEDLKEPSFEELVDFPLIMTDSLLIEQGSFHFSALTTQGPLLLDVSRFNAQVDRFHTEEIRNEKPLWTRLFHRFRVSIPSGLGMEMPGLSTSVGALEGGGPIGDWKLQKVSFHNREGSPRHQTTILKIDLKNLCLKEFLQQNIFKADDAHLENVLFRINSQAGKNELNIGDSLSFSLPFHQIILDRLFLKNGKLNLIGREPSLIEKIEGSLHGVKLDSTLDLRYLNRYFDQALLKVDHLERKLGRWDEYRLSYSLVFDSRKDLMAATKLKVEPRITRLEHSRLIEYRTDYWNIAADSLLLYGVQPGMLFRDELALPRAVLKNTHIRIIRDERLPIREKRKELLQGQVKAIRHPFRIGKLDFVGDVSFVALPQQSARPAFIFFNDIHASLENITNQKRYFDQPMRLKSRGKVYNEGLFELKADFSMRDSLNAFELKGRVGEMNLRLLNKIITPLSRMRIQKGKCRSIDFDISANDDFAIGEMLFKYNNLKVQLVNRKDLSQVNLGNTLLSFWANQIVKSNNPSFLRNRKGIIYFERNPYKETLNLWVHSLLSGMVSSVGMGNNKRKLKRMGIDELEALNYQELFGDLLGKRKSDPEKVKKKLKNLQKFK
jgi:hypothetical protein